jgi:murein DD-endopeptidase MepM/ murein hydrolase activator NlpD
VTARLNAALACLCLGLVLSGGASATPPLQAGPPATATGLAIQIVGPDLVVASSSGQATAPPTASPEPAPFRYPDDGSVVSADETAVSVSASAVDGTAAVVSEVTKLSLFGGEITADDVRASVSSAGTIGDMSDSTVTNLVVLGAPVPVAPNTKIPLADWGTALLLAQSTSRGGPSSPSWRGTLTALVVHLNADHGGLAAGSELRIGFADAYARPPATPGTTTTVQGSPAAGPKKAPAAARPARPARPAASRAGGGFRAADTHRRPGPGLPGSAVPLLAAPDVTPDLTAGRYVFPVYGPSAYGDTFGAPRGDVAGGWHHGDDIFAPLGAPVLAVADGTVFSVGWNDVGGFRLWLRDRTGNEFYYAHLSAYTTLAVNGRHVQAGDVLGFVGNTGDAATTPFHLHFEVHPVAMLFLGYDGAVNPTRYLDGWKRLEDVRILPAVPFALPGRRSSGAPPAGAILLQSSDISTANGLEPGSLARAMKATATLDVTLPQLGDLPVPLPVLDRA